MARVYPAETMSYVRKHRQDISSRCRSSRCRCQHCIARLGDESESARKECGSSCQRTGDAAQLGAVGSRRWGCRAQSGTNQYGCVEARMGKSANPGRGRVWVAYHPVAGHRVAHQHGVHGRAPREVHGQRRHQRRLLDLTWSTPARCPGWTPVRRCGTYPAPPVAAGARGIVRARQPYWCWSVAMFS